MDDSMSFSVRGPTDALRSSGDGEDVMTALQALQTVFEGPAAASSER